MPKYNQLGGVVDKLGRYIEGEIDIARERGGEIERERERERERESVFVRERERERERGRE